MTDLNEKKEKQERQEKIEQMQNLIVLLNQAARAYYQESREIMPNYEYDRLYDMLEGLEKETGVTLSGSPTMRVGYEVLSDLPKEAHPQKMLSPCSLRQMVLTLSQSMGVVRVCMMVSASWLVMSLSCRPNVLIPILRFIYRTPFYFLGRRISSDRIQAATARSCLRQPPLRLM